MQVYDFFECIGKDFYVLQSNEKHDILNVEIKKLTPSKNRSEIHAVSSKKVHFLQGEKVQNIPDKTSIIAFKQVFDEYDALSRVLMVFKEELSFSKQGKPSCWLSFFSLPSDELQHESQEAYEFEFINRIEIPCDPAEVQVFFLDGPIVIVSNPIDGQVWTLNKYDQEYFSTTKVDSKLPPNSSIQSCLLVKTASVPHVLVQIQKGFGNEYLTLGIDGRLCSSCSYLPEMYGDEQVTCMYIIDSFSYDSSYLDWEDPDSVSSPWLVVGTSNGSIYFYHHGIQCGSYVLQTNVPITDMALVSKATSTSKAVLALHSTVDTHPFILLQVDICSLSPLAVAVTLLQEFEHVGRWFQVQDFEVKYRLLLLHAMGDKSPKDFDLHRLVDKCLCIQPQVNSFLTEQSEVDTQKMRLNPKPVFTKLTTRATGEIYQVKKIKQKNRKEQKKKLKTLQTDHKKLMTLLHSLTYRLEIGKKEHERLERIVQDKQNMIKRLDYLTTQTMTSPIDSFSSFSATKSTTSPPPQQLVELIFAAASKVDDEVGMDKEQIDMSLTATQAMESSLMEISETQELSGSIQTLSSIRLVSCIERDDGFYTVTLSIHKMESLLSMEEEAYSVLIPSLEECFSITKRSVKQKNHIQLTVDVPICPQFLVDKLDAVVLRHYKSTVQIMGTFQLDPMNLLAAQERHQPQLSPCSKEEAGDCKVSLDLMLISGAESLYSMLDVDSKHWQKILVRPSFALVRVEAPSESMLKLRTRLLMDSLRRRRGRSDRQTKDDTFYTIPHVLSVESLGQFRLFANLLRQELELLQKYYHHDHKQVSSELLNEFYNLQVETDRQASQVLKLLQDRMNHRTLWHSYCNSTDKYCR